MGSLSKLAEMCMECPFVDECDNKRMECVAYLPDPSCSAKANQDLSLNASMPIARETVERHAYGEAYTMYKDELEKILYDDLYKELYKGLCASSSMLQGG